MNYYFLSNKFLWATLLLVSITVQGQPLSDISQTKDNEPEFVSIINLIATPEKYHQKKVIVGGFVQFHLEDQSLCLIRDPASKKECLWLEIDKNTINGKHNSIFKKHENEYATVFGSFDMNNQGHFDGWSGAIYDITKVSVSSKKSKSSPKNTLKK